MCDILADFQENMRNYSKKIFKYFVMIGCDLLSVFFATALVYFFRNDNDLGGFFSKVWLVLLICAAIKVLILFLCHQYSYILKNYSIKGAIWLTPGYAVFFVIFIIFVAINKKNGGTILFRDLLLYIAIDYIVTLALRFSVRLKNAIIQYIRRAASGDKERIIVVGAGDAGATIVKEMLYSDKTNRYPVALIDDDLSKKGSTIEGVKVVGTTDDLKKIYEKYDADGIIVAMPAVPAERLKDIYAKCHKVSRNVLTLPGVYQLVNGVKLSNLKKIDMQDLLGREPVKVNLDEIMEYIEHKVVLVTGGGGSIGSELCRQIATHNPAKLIILDIYENNIYDIEQELKFNHPEVNLLTLVASVRDKGKIEDVFKKYRPQIVFNAAAHKHVPLMETSPNEAIKNNVFGTLNVATMAEKYKADRFVQISTDKAVNPTNIMGASKRMCEMIIQAIGKKSDHCEFVAVRFGNVLGSNGSVVPLFTKQIEAGGPVTLTHKDIIRYFMTIPEAVSLVLQSGAYAKGGEIYVLDMGEPVRIYDMAVNLIRLLGHEPDKDIKIVYTGLRPGEKLYEERLMKEEGLKKTANGKISVAKPIDFDEEKFFASLDMLYKAAYEETDEMKKLVHELVPTYTIDKRFE